VSAEARRTLGPVERETAAEYPERSELRHRPASATAARFRPDAGGRASDNAGRRRGENVPFLGECLCRAQKRASFFWSRYALVAIADKKTALR